MLRIISKAQDVSTKKNWDNIFYYIIYLNEDYDVSPEKDPQTYKVKINNDKLIKQTVTS